MTESRVRDTPHGDGRLRSPVRARRRAPPCCQPRRRRRHRGRDLPALATYLPRQGVNVMLFEQPWRRGRPQGRAPARPTLDVGLRAAADALRARTPLSSAAVGRRPVGRRCATRSAPPAAWRCVPAAPARQAGEVPARRAAGAGVPTLVVQGGATRSAARRSSRTAPTRRLAVVPGATTASRCRSGARSARRRPMGIVVEAALEWVVREVVGNSGAAEPVGPG